MSDLARDARVLVIDHRDSFVFNAVEALERLDALVRVVRASVVEATLERELGTFDPHLVVLSPGPGGPGEATLARGLLARHPERAVLGICLGLEILVEACGGVVGRLEHPVHGRATRVHHDGDPLFAGVPRAFLAGRYHSLHALRVGPELEVVARLAPGAPEPVVMAVRHRVRPWVGVQFHPESVLTPEGPRILANALDGACRRALPAGGVR